MNILQRKSIPICIILSFFTCSIYYFYWIYCLAGDINNISRDPDSMSPAIVVLLTIFTCGIYFWVWSYQAGVLLDQKVAELGGVSESRGMTYIILSIFGLGWVTCALMQDTINKFADNNMMNNKTVF